MVHPFYAESERELSLEVGDYVVVRKVYYLLPETNESISNPINLIRVSSYTER